MRRAPVFWTSDDAPAESRIDLGSVDGVHVARRVIHAPDERPVVLVIDADQLVLPGRAEELLHARPGPGVVQQGLANFRRQLGLEVVHVAEAGGGEALGLEDAAELL